MEPVSDKFREALEETPYDNGGTLAPGTSWISLPEETRVLSFAEMEKILEVMRERPTEPITFIDGRNY
ncbi:hypothetical protein ACFW08_05945 [Streptomyces sp. NPDC058960]|uniref:hypothetical protein n=1 Tax=Streptomyces sp. NPDC058960 TaxID=3346679 RepID=UPI0036C1E324